jgi:hypothetical protein
METGRSSSHSCSLSGVSGLCHHVTQPQGTAFLSTKTKENDVSDIEQPVGLVSGAFLL